MKHTFDQGGASGIFKASQKLVIKTCQLKASKRFEQIFQQRRYMDGK